MRKSPEVVRKGGKTILEPQAFEDVKAFLDDIIAYTVVTVDGKETKCPIHRRERMKDGRVAVYIQITPEENRIVTVQKEQLYNKIRQLWANHPWSRAAALAPLIPASARPGWR